MTSSLENTSLIPSPAAIIGGSASTFRAFLKRYVPRLWDSSSYGTGGHPYNQSTTGDFALKSRSPGRGSHLTKDENGGVNDLDNHSEDAFPARTGSQKSILGADAKNGILMSKEFTMQVTEAEGPSKHLVAPFN